jgi:site-specific DNA-cytosine methylase
VDVVTRTAVSLFAGVEGIGLALESAGVDVVAAVEIDRAARGVIRAPLPQPDPVRRRDEGDGR